MPRKPPEPEPGLDKKLPGKNALRPNSADPMHRSGSGREALEYVQSIQFVHDYGAPRDGWAAQSPASPRFVKPRPGKEPERPDEKQRISITTGIFRQ